MSDTVCALCGRSGLRLTRHHLIPRAMHTKARIRKKWDKETLRTRSAMVCSGCHKQIHAVLTEKELADSYHSVEALREHPELAKYIRWAQKRNPRGPVTVRRKRI